MRFPFTTVLATLFASLAIVAVANPTTTSSRSLNPDPSVLQGYSPVNRRAPAPRPASSLPLTNARRLQLGLPLKKPIRRSHAPIAKRSGIPPISINCYISVTNTDSGAVLGYISPQFNDFGEYGYFQPSQAGALSVTLSYQPTDLSSPVNIIANNSPDPTVSFFGGIVGYASSSDDLGPGNPNYNYIGGTVQVASGAQPTDGGNSFEDLTQIDEHIESAIWLYDPINSLLTPQWINSDGSSTATSLIYVSDEPLFLMTGDVSEFKSFYGLGNSITFTAVLI
jgi:hypothetical protein